MPNLTDIISAGSAGTAVGQYLNLKGDMFGVSANIGGQQFVQTGYLIPYDSTRHAGLINFSRPYGIVTGNVLPNIWIQYTATVSRAIKHVNGWYHMIETNYGNGTWGSPSQNVRMANSLTALYSAPTANVTPFTTATGIGDTVEFNNGILVAGYSGVNPYTTIIFRSNATNNGYSTVYTSATISAGSYGGSLVVANSSYCVAYPHGYIVNGESSVFTTPDGINWTPRTTTGIPVAEFQCRVFYSPAASAFFYMPANNTTYYTSTNGYDFTPRSVSGLTPGYAAPNINNAAPPTQSQGLVAHSPTATLVSMGSGKIMRITGVTTYTISYPFRGTSSSTAKADGGNFVLAYDGTRFLAFPCYAGSAWNSFGYAYMATCFVSTDDGLTWSPNYSFCGAHANTSTAYPQVINNVVDNISIANNRIFISTRTSTAGTGQESPVFDITGKIPNGTPDYVGYPIIMYSSPAAQQLYYLRVF